VSLSQCTRSRLVRLGAATMLIGLVALTPGLSRAHAAVPTVTPVVLQGEGTDDVAAEIASWQNDISGETNQNTTVDYSDNGGESLARSDFEEGNADYLISGVPFQASDLADVAGGASGIIAAPIMPSGLDFLFNPPDGGFSVTKEDADGNVTGTVHYGPDDGNVVPYVPGETIPGCPAAGCPPFNVPNFNLAAMVQADGRPVADSSSDDPLDYWGRPEVLSTWDQSALDYDPSTDTFNPQASTPNGPGAPATFLPFEAEASSYYMQEYFTATAPNEWKFPGPITETLPTSLSSSQPTSNGIQDMVTNFEKDSNPKAGGTSPAGGTIGIFPPSGATLVDASETAQAEAPHSGPAGSAAYYAVPDNLQLQNANGDWVSPTPSAIEAGVDAGAAAGESACSSTNSVALYAMNNKVAGAYPLSWVDCLYAPSSGLSVAKADAIAGLIRYLVTTGQSYTVPNGDGALPATYVTQALAAANTVITDNCPGAGGKVVLTSRPTAWSPTSAGVAALGAVDECESAPAASAVTPPVTSKAPTATTGTVAAAPSSFAGTGSFDSSLGDLSDLAPATITAPSSSAAAPTASSASTPSAKGERKRKLLTASIATSLPDPLSTSFDQGIDRLSALLVGGALFLVGRRIFRSVTNSGPS
jgi:hypothetical protein